MAKTSYIYHELLKLLGQSEQWADIRHLHTLIWMVIGLICSGAISLTKWTTYVNIGIEVTAIFVLGVQGLEGYFLADGSYSPREKVLKSVQPYSNPIGIVT